MVLPYGCADSGGPAEGEYTITFDSMGGTEIAPITVAAGAYAEKPDNPTKDGHIFKGWYLDLSDTESGSFLFDETPITQNIQLYALWQIRTFKVSFLDDSGNEIIPSATYDWGSLLEEPDTDSLEKDGFVIKWYKENGDLWDFATSKVISNTTLTLRYISNKDSYIGKEVADNFYPTYDKIITDPEMCSETYNEDTDVIHTMGRICSKWRSIWNWIRSNTVPCLSSPGRRIPKGSTIRTERSANSAPISKQTPAETSLTTTSRVPGILPPITTSSLRG